MDVKITQLLRPENIRLYLKATDKTSAIEEMVDMIGEENIADREELLNCLYEREKLETTGVGEGIALPHGRTDAVKDMHVVFARSKEGVEFQSLDDKPVYLLFLITAPRNESTKVLKMLAKLSRFLNNPSFRQELLDVKSTQDIINMFKEKEG
ncbi:MAG: PTS sugar transporter subunit IIA [Candidatus Schekmanbacteria bacterium]|nr:PTS sugar transporter subunit IIA [Candidatus Schekmanbacteria bacterium]